MDKILNGVKDFGTIKRYLEAINQTTDDFLFVYDIKNNQNHFFGSITDVLTSAVLIKKPSPPKNYLP